MGRISMKNNMRTPEEKEAIVLEYLNGCAGYQEVANAHGVSQSLIRKWIKKYRENGIEGLRSRTGRHPIPNNGKYNRHPSEVEKLKKELLKKDEEMEQLTLDPFTGKKR